MKISSNGRDVLGEFEKVKVKDIIYSLSSYYNINDGEIIINIRTSDVSMGFY